MVALFVLGATLLTEACSGGPGSRLPVAFPRWRAEVAVIGDSLSTGFATPGDPWTRDADLLLSGHRRAVHFVNAAENGAGYVSAGEYGDTFVDEAAHVVNARS